MKRYQPKKQKQPVKAIREHCIECVGGRESKGYLRRVSECGSPDCALYDFRHGHNPFRKKPSDKQLLCARDNLKKARKGPKPPEILNVI